MYPRNLNLASNHNYTFWMKTNKQTKQNRKKKKRGEHITKFKMEKN